MPRTRSDQLFASASRLIPGGVNSPLRACRDVQGRPRLDALTGIRGIAAWLVVFYHVRGSLHEIVPRFGVPGLSIRSLRGRAPDFAIGRDRSAAAPRMRTLVRRP